MVYATHHGEWTAIHLFGTDLDRVLCGPVSALVRWFAQRTSPVTNPYFFIRYGEGGPHIRLRILAEPHVGREFLREVEKMTAGDESVVRWEAHPYEPECERYGGAEHIAAAERQFFGSSATVLALLQERDTWPSAWRTAVAIRMAVAFGVACEMSTGVAVPFFERLSQAWMGAAIRPELLEEQKSAMRHRLQAAFRETFDAQAGALLDLCSDLRGTPLSDLEHDEELGAFIAATRAYAIDLGGCGEAALEARRWEALSSAVHMNNNRIGVLNNEEAFIAATAARILEWEPI